MLYVSYFITIILLIYGLLKWRQEKRRAIQNRITAVFQMNEVETERFLEPTDEMKKLSFSKRIIAPIWKKIVRSYKSNLSNEKKEKIEMNLLQAGNPFGMSAVEFRIVQASLYIILPIIFGLYSFLLQPSTGVILLFILGGFAVASYVPSYYLKQKAKARNKKALQELPDFIDLLTVSIEAGLGFDSALSKVVSKKDGVLSREFQRSLEEMRLGKTRKEALSGVRERIFIDDVKSLIGSIIQAEQLGIGMVQVLNVQSSEIREKRKQRAEEQAMKAPIKMLFPLVLFIFPSLFVVLLGPAIIGLIDTFQ
ncbi:type II secretion system F family protein [Oceanobacillus halophilus]|uniref:Type II secretion system F family protein n=1 Tax=Oceanobacillus halophilus TaxID=930130 RepID=A0A495A1B4_9BACI|nr:type II secretion system F family protein [Oceanobacillus halophilus]RKQ33253.1 type II secretion system F family protein [Oceanobacillus halophilus]